MPAMNKKRPQRRGVVHNTRRRQLRIESLETRSLLATFLVNTDSTLRDAAIDGVCDVNSFEPGPQCSLRAAIEEANANADVDIIRFDAPVSLIPSAPSFPAISNPVHIEGPGADKLKINQSLTFNSGSNILRDVAIEADVSMIGSSNQVYGVHLATGNITRSLAITGNNNRVGSSTISERNVLRRIVVSGSDNIVQGNLIGTDATGMAPLPNLRILANPGITVVGNGNRIGGAKAGEGNIVSGFSIAAVEVQGATADGSVGNLIQGNTIGLNATGTATIPNGLGIRIHNAKDTEILNNRIGGSTGASAVSDGAGITLELTSSETRIRGNQIGISTELANFGPGIEIRSNGNTIAGTDTQDENTIAFNRGDGVVVHSGGRNTIRRNQIFSNGGLGINLRENRFGALDGVTSNDPQDADFGTASDGGGLANALQNFPVLSVNPGTRVIEGTLNSEPSSTYQIDFYSNDQIDPSGHGEGQLYLGSLSVTTDATGNTSVFRPPFLAQAGKFVTATATSANGNTSEFSAVSTRQPFIVNSTRDSTDTSSADGRCDTGQKVTVNGQQVPECTLRAAIEQANQTVGLDSIHFNISGTSVIELTDTLPSILDAIVIDATTDPDYVDSPVIELVLPPGIPENSANRRGLTLASDNNFVSGLRITGKGERVGDGLAIFLNSGTTIERTEITGFDRGIAVRSSDQIVLGGVDGRGNVIGNNGVGISFESTVGAEVQGNFLNVDRNGVQLGSQDFGIRIQRSSNILIGGEGQAANTIQKNRIGIAIGTPRTSAGETLDTSAGIQITNNHISGNEQLGIDIITNASTVGMPNKQNDLNDADSGPNGMQNHPALVGAAIDLGESQNAADDKTVITGGLTGVPGAIYSLEFYASSKCHASLYGEGEVSLGTVPLKINQADGREPFIVTSLDLDRDPLPGQYITATATDINGNTSEFSHCVLIDDLDRDGQIESNNVDGNQDGIADNTQPAVSTFQALPNQQATLVAAVGQIALAAAVPNPSPDDAPQATYPMGFLNFGITDIPSGGNATVELLLPTGVTVNAYFMYGPTLDNATPHWFDFKFDGTTGAEFLAGKIRLHFVDGGRGDLDLTADGEILDPGAPAFVEVPIRPWQNSQNALDADNNGKVEPIDALLVINRLNDVGLQVLPTPTDSFAPPPFYDVDGDGSLAPIDALLIINFLNTPSGEPTLVWRLQPISRAGVKPLGAPALV